MYDDNVNSGHSAEKLFILGGNSHWATDINSETLGQIPQYQYMKK